MKKTLILASVCLCAGSLGVTGAAWAKKGSNCKDADVVLSKKFPHFDLAHGCAYNDADECDPDYSNIVDDPVNGLVIDGTNKKNTIHGSSGPDVICGGNGKDEIWGEEGDDVIYGGNGKDKLYGGLGNDTLYGGNGKDDLSGYDDTNDGVIGVIEGEDNDDLYGENGKDELTGGPGDDSLDGGKGKDYLDGGDGDDDIDGGKGKDECVDSDGGETDECEATELEDSKKKK